MFEEFIQVELRAGSHDAQEVYNMYFLGVHFAIGLQSLQSERHLSDNTWKVVFVSKCTQGQSFCDLHAICIELFCNCIFTAISHNVALTHLFGPGMTFFNFKVSCCFPIFKKYFYIGTARAKQLAMCDWGLKELPMNMLKS